MKKYYFKDSPISYSKEAYDEIRFLCKWAGIKPGAQINHKIFLKMVREIELIKYRLALSEDAYTYLFDLAVEEKATTAKDIKLFKKNVRRKK